MEKSFLQSPVWLEFQKSLGRKVWQVEGIGVIKHNLPLGKSYLYAPRCAENFLSENFLHNIKEIAKQENAIFFKIEPAYRQAGPENKFDLEKSGFRKSHSIQPIKTLILDITKSEQDLLNQMHYKTRYNIQLALKKGIEVKSQKSPKQSKLATGQAKVKNFEEFWRLMEQTAKRGSFRTHPKEYYQKMLEIPAVELFWAEFKGRVLAANLVFFWDKIATYLHGASDYKYRNFMAPFLLQWEQIKEAKKRGCNEYDFWGIDENKWPGVTRFKKGFGGREVEYPGAYDLIFQPIWYLIYKFARKIL